MNRIFHARIAWYQYLLLLVLAINLMGLLWYKHIVPAAVIAMLLLVLIERIIHTTYTVTADNLLIISRGRFTRKKTITLAQINAIRRCNSMKFGSFSVTNYLLIEYNINKFVSVTPIKQQEFVEVIQNRMHKSSSVNNIRL